MCEAFRKLFLKMTENRPNFSKESWGFFFGFKNQIEMIKKGLSKYRNIQLRIISIWDSFVKTSNAFNFPYSKTRHTTELIPHSSFISTCFIFRILIKDIQSTLGRLIKRPKSTISRELCSLRLLKKAFDHINDKIKTWEINFPVFKNFLKKSKNSLQFLGVKKKFEWFEGNWFTILNFFLWNLQQLFWHSHKKYE
jgi:hypothetical protein